MTIEEVYKRKQKMELEMLSALTKSIEAFKADTGVSPQSIDVCLVEVTTLGNALKQYIIGNVDARIII
jgi:hypothetical protein